MRIDSQKESFGGASMWGSTSVTAKPLFMVIID